MTTRHEGNTHTISSKEYLKVLKVTEKHLIADIADMNERDDEDVKMFHRSVLIKTMRAIAAIDMLINSTELNNGEKKLSKSDIDLITAPAEFITFDVPSWAFFIRVVHNGITLVDIAVP